MNKSEWTMPSKGPLTINPIVQTLNGAFNQVWLSGPFEGMVNFDLFMLSGNNLQLINIFSTQKHILITTVNESETKDEKHYYGTKFQVVCWISPTVGLLQYDNEVDKGLKRKEK